jgi:hypothetical protein
MGLHHDNYINEQAILYTSQHPELEKDSTVTDQKYSCVVYLNNIQGGELYYPYQDILYQPKAGDMIIHDATSVQSLHGGKRLKSDARYMFTGTLYKRVPVTSQAPIIQDYKEYYDTLKDVRQDID